MFGGGARNISKLIYVLVALAICGAVHAQMTAPTPIDGPVQEVWRRPLEGFLGELGIKDRAVVEKTFAIPVGGGWHTDSILFRIEHPTTCSEDTCFTVIGHIADGKLVPELMFLAGKFFTRSDHAERVFGFNTFQIFLTGAKSAVRVLETPNGWISITDPPN
jgi:hypothetical protein